ncbi:MAG: hypothetical protein Q4D08_05805 [Clostridia bacterium]|nr:hypothetical protein [Clostridia bacterium]
MAIKKCVSAKTHTQKQLDDYANQHNPNNKAYQARIANEKKTKKSTRKQEAKRQAALFDELGLNADLDWMCYSNPYDFD